MKRTADRKSEGVVRFLSVVRFTDCRSIASPPSAEALGYFHSVRCADAGKETFAARLAQTMDLTRRRESKHPSPRQVTTAAYTTSSDGKARFLIAQTADLEKLGGITSTHVFRSCPLPFARSDLLDRAGNCFSQAQDPSPELSELNSHNRQHSVGT